MTVPTRPGYRSCSASAMASVRSVYAEPSMSIRTNPSTLLATSSRTSMLSYATSSPMSRPSMVSLTEMFGSQAGSGHLPQSHGIRIDGCARLSWREDVLSQAIQRRRQSLRLQLGGGGQRIVEQFTGHEASNQRAGPVSCRGRTARFHRARRWPGFRCGATRQAWLRHSPAAAPPSDRQRDDRRAKRQAAKEDERRFHARGIDERARRGGSGDETDVAGKTNGADGTPASAAKTKDEVTGRAVAGHLTDRVEGHRRQEPRADGTNGTSRRPTAQTPNPTASAGDAPNLRMTPPMGTALARWITLTNRSNIPTCEASKPYFTDASNGIDTTQME